MFGLNKFLNNLSLNKIISQCKSMVSKKSSNSILHNRVLLYAILILALLDLFYLANMKDFKSVIVFVLVGVLTAFFCKNMIVILFVAICITHILKYPTSLEGAENMDAVEEETKKENEQEEEKKENMENEEDEEKKENELSTKQATNDMKEFMEVQDKIIGGMAELEPLMQKAEGFIEKFEKYSKYK